MPQLSVTPTTAAVQSPTLANNAAAQIPANTLDLKDIHLPEQISNYPLAYGWWLLTALILIVVVISVIKIKSTMKRNKVKQQALAQLKQHAQLTTSETIALLKWAAMHYFSRVELAKLYGASLQEFFLSKLASKHQQKFAQLSKQAFVNQYHGDNTEQAQSNEQLSQAAVLWLNHALPPAPLKIEAKVASSNSTTAQNVSAGVNL